MILEMDQDQYRTEHGVRQLVRKANGEIDRTEFLVYMLVKLQKCRKRDIEHMLRLFDDLDKSRDGSLSALDIIQTPRELRHAQ